MFVLLGFLAEFYFEKMLVHSARLLDLIRKALKQEVRMKISQRHVLNIENLMLASVDDVEGEEARVHGDRWLLPSTRAPADALHAVG